MDITGRKNETLFRRKKRKALKRSRKEIKDLKQIRIVTDQLLDEIDEEAWTEITTA